MVPQMFPLPWLLLFTSSILTIFILTTIIHFSFNPSIKYIYLKPFSSTLPWKW